MKDELQEHKTSDKIKWVITGIGFLLVFVILIGVCLQLFGTDKQKPSEWFKNTETEQVTPDNGGENDTPITATPSNAVSRTMAKPMSASIENDGEIQLFSSSATTGNVIYDNGSISLYVNDLGGGIYNVHGITCSSMDTQRGASHIVGVLNGMEGDEIDGLSMYGGLYFYRINYSSPDYPSGRAAIRFNYFTSDRFGFSDNLPLYQIEFVFSDGRTLTPTIRVFNDRYCLSDVYDGNEIDTIRFMYRTPVSLPADPVKEGYTFVGWYYDSEFTTPYAGEPIYADTSLYAKFEINRYTVTFNSDGGSAVASQTVDWNTSASLSTPTRDGYAFKGWYLSDGTQYTNQAIKADTTLTAKWERNRFTVTFDSNGGSKVENQTVMLNKTVTLSTPTRMGYNFVGWYMADGTKYENQPVTDDLTLTAHWEVIMCTVTFYVDGEVYETKTVEYGTPLMPVASELNLSVMTVYSVNPEFTAERIAKNGITADLSVTAEEATGADKVVNAVKNNTWQIIGGVVCGVALIAIIAAACSGIKRKKY